MKRKEKASRLEWIQRGLILAGVVANLIIWGMVIQQRTQAERELICGVDYYPMANQHIEWSYAGK